MVERPEYARRYREDKSDENEQLEINACLLRALSEAHYISHGSTVPAAEASDNTLLAHWHSGLIVHRSFAASRNCDAESRLKLVLQDIIRDANSTRSYG